jgi:hypothetical protein
MGDINTANDIYSTLNWSKSMESLKKSQISGNRRNSRAPDNFLSEPRVRVLNRPKGILQEKFGPKSTATPPSKFIKSSHSIAAKRYINDEDDI